MRRRAARRNCRRVARACSDQSRDECLCPGLADCTWEHVGRASAEAVRAADGARPVERAFPESQISWPIICRVSIRGLARRRRSEFG